MRLSIMLEPQEGLTYDDQLAVARRVEATGLEGLYRSDHYATVTGGDATASTDAWAVLAGLARETSGIRLGTLVSPVTFRPAGNLAKVAATVAEMAGPAPDGGPRIALGMGTGWLETEHRQFGFPFEEIGVRFDRLGEHLAAVRGLWDPDRDPFDLHGTHVRIEAARFRRTPDPRPRVIVGGKGLRRTPALAARYADELNSVFSTQERCAEQLAALHAACESEGRDPGTICYSLMTGLVVGTTEAEYRARAERLLRRGTRIGDAWVTGTSEQAADRLGRLAEVGVQAVMLQNLLYDDLDVVDLVAREIAPKVQCTDLAG